MARGAFVIPSTPLAARVQGLLLFLPAAVVLGLAAWLSPSHQGMGTHEQLGLAPCGFLMSSGWPCATCGMTTAFAEMAHGHLLRALLVQPAGALLALLTAVCFWVGLWAACTGMALTAWWNWLWRPRHMLLLGALVLLAWAYKAMLAAYPSLQQTLLGS